jgi:DNA recombination protein RmuC
MRLLRKQLLLREMNIQMSKETTNLTKALKGHQQDARNWGNCMNAKKIRL